MKFTKNYILEIESFMARPFIEKWHYTKRVTKGSHFYFGWFVDKELYAVADYGNGANNNQANGLAAQTLCNITATNMLELKRLCRSEPKLDLNLTQFLAKCHRILKQLGYVYILSFTDPDYNHTGCLYQAANFEYLGQTKPDLYYKSKDGVRRHRKFAYNYGKRNNCTTQEAALDLGLIKEYVGPKDRWLLCINKKKRKYEVR